VRRLAIATAVAIAAIGLAACPPGMPGGWGFVHDQELVGPYKLVAVDVREQMVLCRALEGGNCAGDNLPEPTIFAAGGDDRFVVLARHPTAVGERMNRGVAEFYYLERSASETDPRFRAEVLGPFDRDQFEAEKRRLGLPAFSVVFEDLE